MEDATDQETTGVPSFVTPRGNTLTMKASNPFGFYTIFYTDGGETPAELKGNYTSQGPAVTAIQNYIGKIKPLREKGEPAKIKPEQYQRPVVVDPELQKEPTFPENETIFTSTEMDIVEPVEVVQEKPKKPKKVKPTPKKETVKSGTELSS